MERNYREETKLIQTIDAIVDTSTENLGNMKISRGGTTPNFQANNRESSVISLPFSLRRLSVPATGGVERTSLFLDRIQDETKNPKSS